MGLVRALLFCDGWALRWELSRTYRRNYFDRVSLVEDNIHEKLRSEAKVVGAMYCKRMRAKKIIVAKGDYESNGRYYKMFTPDCGNVTWSCFLNGPERRTIREAETVANGPIWIDVFGNGGDVHEKSV